jgi:hypothetical protein
MDDHLRAELTVDALQMARQRRQPARGLICYSDRASWGTPPASTPGRWRLPGCARAWAGWRPASTTPPARASSRPLDRAGPHPHLADPPGRPHRHLQVHRGVLQPPAPPLRPGLPQPHRLREEPPAAASYPRCRIAIPVSTEPGQLQANWPASVLRRRAGVRTSIVSCSAWWTCQGRRAHGWSPGQGGASRLG